MFALIAKSNILGTVTFSVVAISKYKEVVESIRDTQLPYHTLHEYYILGVGELDNNKSICDRIKETYPVNETPSFYVFSLDCKENIYIQVSNINNKLILGAYSANSHLENIYGVTVLIKKIKQCEYVEYKARITKFIDEYEKLCLSYSELVALAELLIK